MGWIGWWLVFGIGMAAGWSLRHALKPTPIELEVKRGIPPRGLVPVTIVPAGVTSAVPVKVERPAEQEAPDLHEERARRIRTR